MFEKDLYATVQKIVRNELTYLRHYYGIVKEAALLSGSGCYACTVPALGWFDPVPVWPRFPGTLLTLQPGDVVDIGFLEGDENRPVWYGIAGEQAEQVMATVLKSHVLGEDLLAALDAMVAVFNGHTHTVAAAPGPTTPPLTPQTAPAAAVLSKVGKTV